MTQATSPYFAPEAFWCIEETIAETFAPHEGIVYPYVNVPSFGEWGFVMASKRGLDWSSDKSLEAETKFLTTEKIPTLFIFGQDITKDRVDIESNHLLQPGAFSLL